MRRYERFWVHSDPDAPEDKDQARRCARGERCAAAMPGPADEGVALVADWAEPGIPFCHRDEMQVTRALAGVPARYVHLRTVIGIKGQSGDDRVSMSRTAPVPIRLDVDALIRDMIVVVCSWEEHMAGLDQLSRPATWLSRLRRDERMIPAAVAVLVPRLGALLRAGPVTMVRYLPLRAASVLPPGTVGWVHPYAEYAEVNTDLDGAAAGLELLDLEFRCRKTLGETLPPPVALDGVPCKACEHLALEVAPEPEYRSSCADCGDLLTPDEYRTWTRRYQAWAKAQVMACELEPNDPATFWKIAA